MPKYVRNEEDGQEGEEIYTERGREQGQTSARRANRKLGHEENRNKEVWEQVPPF